MKKIEQVIFLHEEMGLGFYQIAKLVEGCRNKEECSKAALKLYGMYRSYKKRKEGIIIDSSAISFDTDHYVKSKIHEDHEPIFIGDLRKERIELARQLKYLRRDDPKRAEIYRRINEIKLLELLIMIYDMIGLAEYDRDRMYLQLIYSIGRKLIKRIDLSKDHAKWRRGGIEHLSEEAAAFVYICYFAALYNTQYQRFLDKIREIIYSIMRGRSKEKKIRRIQEIIKEKYNDALSNIILRL